MDPYNNGVFFLIPIGYIFSLLKTYIAFLPVLRWTCLVMSNEKSGTQTVLVALQAWISITRKTGCCTLRHLEYSLINAR